MHPAENRSHQPTMNIAVFHGSPRKGNTYKATKIFMDELLKCGNVQYTEFFFPEALPEFCAGCQLCLGNPPEMCPHSQHVAPILNAVINSDALVFATPHYGACTMPAGMKTLLDHLDFLTLTVAPRSELFSKKAFIITTGSGSKAAAKPIKSYLKNWGMNRVSSLGFRMFTDKWDNMSKSRQIKSENKLRRSARRFYIAPKRRLYASTLFMYHMSKYIIKKHMGEDAYPYKYWQENGYFRKRPF